jgi:hypothetical protein
VEHSHLSVICAGKHSVTCYLEEYQSACSGEWPCSCDVCNKTSRVHVQLRIHLHLHSVMGCGGCPHHRHHYLKRVSAATTLDNTMTHLIYKDECLFVCMFVCLFVCLYLIQIHISEPIGIKLCTRLPLGLEEYVGYVWARNSWPFRPFGLLFFRGCTWGQDGCCRYRFSRYSYIRGFSWCLRDVTDITLSLAVESSAAVIYPWF